MEPAVLSEAITIVWAEEMRLREAMEAWIVEQRPEVAQYVPHLDFAVLAATIINHYPGGIDVFLESEGSHS